MSSLTLHLPNNYVELGTHLANYLDGLDGSKDGRIAYTNCTTVWK